MSILNLNVCHRVIYFIFELVYANVLFIGCRDFPVPVDDDERWFRSTRKQVVSAGLQSPNSAGGRKKPLPQNHQFYTSISINTINFPLTKYRYFLPIESDQSTHKNIKYHAIYHPTSSCMCQQLCVGALVTKTTPQTLLFPSCIQIRVESGGDWIGWGLVSIGEGGGGGLWGWSSARILFNQIVIPMNGGFTLIDLAHNCQTKNWGWYA